MGDEIHVYLSYNIIVIKTSYRHSSTINETSGKTPTSAIDPTHCINKAMLLSGIDVDHTREEVLNSPDR
jgi:hypothetical protein